MRIKLLQNGFSLPEVLMATGILAVGLIMIGGTFPVAIFLTTASVEQTAAPIAADEAVAKMQLYGFNSLNLNPVNCQDFRNVALNKPALNEYWYPSINDINDYQRTYCWSAICRGIFNEPDLVQATIFVSRKGVNGLSYYQYNGGPITPGGLRPTPVKITALIAVNGSRMLTLNPGDGAKYIHEGASIVADGTGNIYRVLSRDADVITLYTNWTDGASDFWVVPPPTTGGRSPCIGVYQRIIRF